MFWGLVEGHACEISVSQIFISILALANIAQARRNAMDVSIVEYAIKVTKLTQTLLQNASKNAGEMINKYVSMAIGDITLANTEQVPDSVQPSASSRHYQRAGRDYHRCHCQCGHVEAITKLHWEEVTLRVGLFIIT